MYGSLFSVLLMGMVPAWGAQGGLTALSHDIRVAPPTVASQQEFASLDDLLSASGVLIVDLDSGQTVYERSPAVSRPMASLTKLMTALIIVEHHELDEVVEVPADIEDIPGTVSHLPPNEEFTIGDLLAALLIDSANDAAVALAVYHSGSVEDFVSEMNERATQLGLSGTSYENPIGLDAPAQESSPRDLAWLTMYVMQKPAIAERMSTPTMRIHGLNGTSISLLHTHHLLRAEDKDILAGKTGTTDEAGQCLLSIVEAKGRRYIAVLLHSRDRYADMRRVLDALTQ